eukprot:jgi/Ulvmu1/10015/UM059_0064.1
MGVLSTVLQLILYPEELAPQLRLKKEAKRIENLVRADPDIAFCYGMLNRVSRSFAMVIQQLPEQLRDPVCIFYLVLRALDTVEDDMALPLERKLPLLHTFHEKISDEQFSMDDCGENDYKELLEQYPKVTRVYNSLDKDSQYVIQDIAHRMGVGMAEFIEKEVVTLDDFDLYCHYVAGLVGIGLCHIFAATGCEDQAFAIGMDELANHMGLFLQKTNIIRDYLEDILEEPAPRMFWPREIWGKYAGELDEFKEPKNRKQAIQCLNHMIANALQHAPHCIQYMAKLKDRQVFAFCAIPQIMALSTLALCYNNGKVFEGVVKMRRGQTAVVFDQVENMGSLYQQFFKWGNLLLDKAKERQAAGDPSADTVIEEITTVLGACPAGAERHGVPLVVPSQKPLKLFVVVVCLMFCLLAFNLALVRNVLHMPDTATSALADRALPVVGIVFLLFNTGMLFVA